MFGRLYSLGGALGFALLLLIAASAARADTPITLQQSFAGNLDFESTGGNFRTTAGGCTVNSTATGTLPGLPAGATIRAAYLYYGHSVSGPNVTDPAVTLTINGSANAIAADRTFTAQFQTDPEHYAGGFEDITGLVAPSTSSTTFTLSNLNIYTGEPHCGFATVFGGFAIVVIYEEASEPLRVINVFDGFQQFYGSQITLSPTNFRVPVSPVDGKQLVITWEGDAGNSGSLNGFTEGITYNGVNLPVPGDPFNLGGINPQNNDFNSTISAQGLANVFGVDVDTYDLSTILQPGDTSGSTVYSTGGDYVFLAAEVISATNTPVSDLSISKSHSGDFVVGQQGTWSLTVTNNGPSDETGNITVTDDLSALSGIDFVSATGTGWSCSETSGVVTCDYTAGLADGATTPPITLTVDVTGAAAPSVTNTASVVGSNFDNVSGNDQASDPTNVLVGDLSTSTKVGVDENGGDLLNGDTILYTITLTETAGLAVADAQIVDDLDASLSGFAEVQVPAGALTTFNPTGGANGTGQWTVTNIDLDPNETVTLQFRVAVAGAATGEAIDNSAVLTAEGVSETLDANTFIVDQSSLPASGDKPLYFSIDDSDSDGGGNDQPIGIQRALPIIPFAERDNRRVELDEPDTFVWDLTPGLVDDLVIDAGTVRVDLFLTEEGDGNQRDFRIDLERISGGSFANATRTNVTLSTTNSAPTLVTTFVNVGNETITPAQGLRIRLTNQSTGSSNRRIRVWMQSQSVTTNEFDSRSKLLIPTSTVVNVDTLGAFDDSFANGGGNAVGIVSPNEQIFLRAEVSDPFGTFDIAGATIRIVDAAGTEVLATTAMVEEADDGLIKTFETPFTPNDANLVPQTTGPAGDWTYTVIAEEGDSAEGVANQIFHTRNATFELALPSLMVMKFSPQVISDPINDPDADPPREPKRIPGAVVRYEIQVSNQGLGRPDGNDTLTISDVFPQGILLAVPDAGDPITMAPSAGVTLDFANDVAFTFSTGTTPVDGDGDGCYDNVTGFTVTPTGQMEALVPPGAAPTFTLIYDACLQ